jgi:hypothetical protein
MVFNIINVRIAIIIIKNFEGTANLKLYVRNYSQVRKVLF